MLERYVAELRDTSKPITYSQLVTFCDLDAEELKQFKSAWASLETKRRRQIMSRLVQLADDNFELNFDAIFRFGLSDPDEVVQLKAIEGLSECEDCSLIDSLVYLMRGDSVEAVRAAAAHALGKFALLAEFRKLRPVYAEKVQNALLAVLNDIRESNEVKRRALESIAPLSLPQVAEAIRRAYLSTDLRMKASAIYAMGRSCELQWLPMLTKELSSSEVELRFEAARAAGELGEEEIIPHVLPLIQDPDTEVQLEAISALGKIGGSEVRQALRSLREDADLRIRQAAEDALKELNSVEDPFSLRF